MTRPRDLTDSPALPEDAVVVSDAPGWAVAAKSTMGQLWDRLRQFGVTIDDLDSGDAPAGTVVTSDGSGGYANAPVGKLLLSSTEQVLVDDTTAVTPLVSFSLPADTLAGDVVVIEASGIWHNLSGSSSSVVWWALVGGSERDTPSRSVSSSGSSRWWRYRQVIVVGGSVARSSSELFVAGPVGATRFSPLNGEQFLAFDTADGAPTAHGPFGLAVALGDASPDYYATRRLLSVHRSRS